MTSIGSSSSSVAPEASRDPRRAGGRSVERQRRRHDWTCRRRRGRRFGRHASTAMQSRILLADATASDGTSARARTALGSKSVDLVEVSHSRVPGDLLDVPYHGMPARARALRERPARRPATSASRVASSSMPASARSNRDGSRRWRRPCCARASTTSRRTTFDIPARAR